MNRLNPSARADLLRAGVELSFDANEVLLHQGASDTHVVLIQRGFVKVTAVAAVGREALLALRITGDLVGEISALNGWPRSATVTTCTPAVVRVIHRPELQAYLAVRPDAAVEIAGMVADRLRWANQLRVEFAAYPVKVRVARVLVKLGGSYGRRTPGGVEIAAPLSQAELASLCGAADVSVQKALYEMRKRNLISTGRRRFLIVDLDSLREYAGLPAEE